MTPILATSTVGFMSGWRFLSRRLRPRSARVVTAVVFVLALVPSIRSFSNGAAAVRNQTPGASAISAGDMARCVSKDFQAKAVIAFDARAAAMKDAIRTQLNPSSSQVLYDTQLLLAPIVEMADDCGDRALLGRLADVLLPAEAGLVRALDPIAGTEQRQWQVNGRESRLNSAQFLHVVGRILSGIAAIPAAERTPTMQQFATLYSRVLGEHLKFWLFEAPYFNPTGCSPDVASRGHREYLSNQRNRSLGSGRSYCSSPADRDLLMTADAAELLRAASIDPVMVGLDGLGIDPAALVAYLNDAADAYRSFFVATNVVDETGANRSGLDFDTGGWRDWTEDHGYSSYTGTSFPSPSDAGTDQRASWDLSHARRLVSLFGSMRGIAPRLNAPFPSDDEMRAFANQLGYGVATDTVRPRFRNYLSGVNGWFRVNYNGRPGFGYGPYESGSVAFIEGGFGLWGQFSPRVAAVTKAVEAVLTATDSATQTFRNDNYGIIWSGGVRTRSLDPVRVALTFYPAAIVPIPPPTPVTTTLAPTTPRITKPTIASATRANAATSLLRSVRWSPSYETKTPSAMVRNARVPGMFAMFLAPEPANVKLVQWYLDGSATHVDDASPPFDLRNGLVEAACGPHVVTLRVTDGSGAIATARIPFTVTSPCSRKSP